MTASAILSPVAYKTCTKCCNSKLFTSEFFPSDGYRLRSACKKCRAAAKAVNTAEREAKFPEKREKRMADVRAYADAHKEEIRKYKRIYAAENSAAIKKEQAEYYIANSSTIKQRARVWKKENPDRRLENNRRWALENPEKSAECSRKGKAKRMSDPLNAFIEKTRSLISNKIRARGYTKRSQTHVILGCEWAFFAAHMERQFLKGMTWGKMGKEIHIDHITPISTAKTEQEVIALNHFTNLRPMWAKDNMAKSDRITHLI